MSDEKAEATEKPLEKMTVKALREIAKDIPEVVGVHGMKKEELIVAINEVRGVEEKTVKADKSIKEKPVKKPGAAPGEIKKQIKQLSGSKKL